MTHQDNNKQIESGRTVTPSSAMPMAVESEEFFEDAGDLDAGRKNAALARLLLGTLHAHTIITIERMDSVTRRGWRVVYRVEG